VRRTGAAITRTLFLAALVVVSAPWALVGPSRPAAPPVHADSALPRPAPQPVNDKILDIANVGPKDDVVALGSRDAQIVIAAARREAYAVGIESSPNVAARPRKGVESAGVGT
jgi:hypothetical protein